MTSEIKELCSIIESYASSCSTSEELYERTLAEIKKYNFSVIYSEYNKGVNLFRIRKNPTDKPLAEVKEIYHPPGKFVLSYGRANKPSQSIFYCSEVRTLCELELLHDYLKNDIGHEQLFTYSEWITQKELKVLVITIPPLNREISNGWTFRDDCFKYINSQPVNERQSYLNFYSFTEHFFFKNAKMDSKVYVICSAIANYLYEAFPLCEGFIYTSVQGVTGYNLILRSEVLENRLILPKKNLFIHKWCVKDKDRMEIDPTYYKVGTIKGKAIEWDN